MGYRSDVALALSKAGVDKFKMALADKNLDAETQTAVKSLLEGCEKHLTDPASGAELWYWTYLKWYSGYPDVDFVEHFINSLEDGEDYRFMRIGEDYEDVEVSGWFSDDPFDLCVTRKISFENCQPA